MEKVLTFDKLPEAVTMLTKEVSELKALLLKKSEQQPIQPQQEIPIYIDEAAKILGIVKPTLYSKVSKREIPFHKRGKKLYFFKSDLLNYIKAGKRKSSAEIEAEADAYLSNKKGLK